MSHVCILTSRLLLAFQYLNYMWVKKLGYLRLATQQLSLHLKVSIVKCWASLPISSQMAPVRSKLHVANTWPNSGWAHVTFHTEPLWAFHVAVSTQFSCSSWSQTCQLNKLSTMQIHTLQCKWYLFLWSDCCTWQFKTTQTICFIIYSVSLALVSSLSDLSGRLSEHDSRIWCRPAGSERAPRLYTFIVFFGFLSTLSNRLYISLPRTVQSCEKNYSHTNTYRPIVRNINIWSNS